ncbi:hypothetical protein HYH03_008897 [Edaphochlamys debaryana]|uniref:Uncharacterized protein n=1 Tax=Edaphochlamys debaryana TaxID=47281 RepID=A0A836BXG9_9CHLO|nr:hypothetical protein HYH03_008897 [Edaphochlamys debaryana]|eukprot:KAG2492731.1 hypothetical protein HYH03_008897 [Edaphochlamys debaryana]
MASAIFAATNDRQRFAAVRSQLLRAIQLIPSAHLTQEKRVRATQLANKATENTRGTAAPAVQQGAALQASDQRRAELMQRLTARTQSVRASVELQKVLVPCLIAWRSATERRLRDFLRVKNRVDDYERNRHLAPISAFCEAARALDACIVALIVLNTPYKAALLAAFDEYDEVKGPYDEPKEISVNSGAHLSLDFELMGLVWGESVLKYAAGAVRNNMTAFVQQTALDMIVKPLDEALCYVVDPGQPHAKGITDPTFRRGVVALLGAAEETAQLCGTRAQDAFPLLWDLVGRLQRSRGVQLDPSGAPPLARQLLAGTVLMSAQPPPQPAQQPQTVDSGSEGEEEGQEPGNGSAGAGPSTGGSGEGVSTGGRRRRRRAGDRNRRAAAAAAAAATPAPAAAAGSPPAAAAPAAVPAASPSGALMASPPPSGDLGVLMPDCCVCLDELGPASVRLLNCSVRGLEGPFHALCGACWAGLERPQCPMCCRRDVKALSPAEFLQALACGPGA